MGFFDLPAPLLGAIDHALSLALPGILRLVLWGVLAGWLTMMIYRRLSNQQRIQQLKTAQKQQQKIISAFDGDFEQLFPLIRHTLALGMRQLGLSLGPALLATIPILFIVIWVAGAFGYQQPGPGAPVSLVATPAPENGAQLFWSAGTIAEKSPDGWIIGWPARGEPVSLIQGGESLFQLPFKRSIPVIHKRQWWNWLMGNPAGYLPDDAVLESVAIDLPEQQFLPFGPRWMRGWMFSFFTSFLLSSIGFKLAMKID